MQISELVALCQDRDWQRLTEHLADFLQKNGVSVSKESLGYHISRQGPLTAAFMGWGTDDPTPVVQNFMSSVIAAAVALPPTQPPPPPPKERPAVWVTSSAALGSSSSSSSRGHSGLSYKQACADVVSTFGTTTPYVIAGIHSRQPGNQRFQRRMKIDTGAGKSAMSWEAWVRDAEVLMAQGVTLVSIKPIQVGLFGKGQAVTCNLLAQNVPVVIGAAVYRFDFLVIPDVAFEYTIGSDFQAAYGMVPDLSKGCFNIIMSSSSELVPGGRFPPIPWWGRNIPNWVYRQRLPLHYEGRQLRLEVQDHGRS
jgi:hypothetical protein